MTTLRLIALILIAYGCLGLIAAAGTYNDIAERASHVLED